MRAIISILTVCVVALAVFSSCVDHRPLRNEVFNENVYLPKELVTRENPHKPGSGDHAWLFTMTMMKASNPLHSDYLLSPGTYAGVFDRTRYVRFQFANDKLEMVDDNEYAPLVKDAQGNLVTSPSVAPTVLGSWPGTHVDIKMRDNLDGERTNVIEENRERDWQQRQYFKVDFSKATVPEFTQMFGMYSGLILSDCYALKSVSLVPDSVEIEDEAVEGGDDYISWTVSLTYESKIFQSGEYYYYCPNTLADAMNRNTYTFHVKYAFWRVPKSDYKPLEVAEKDPIRSSMDFFETPPVVYFDPKTALPGAKTYVMRFDPEKEHTFYFSPSFPDRYKDFFRNDIKKQLNDLMTTLNVKMRVDFQDWNHDGVERKVGDPRYNMLVYHDMPLNTGLGGLAILVPDPRTGEMLSGGFNVYDWGRAFLAYYVQDFLTEITSDTFDDDDNSLPKTCTPGDLVPIDKDKIEDKHKNTSLYAKLETYMGQPAEEWVPKRSEDFGKYMRMMLPDLRYASPGSNMWVNSGGKLQPAELRDMLQKDAEFLQHMASIDRGESPFGGQTVLGKTAIENGLAAIKLVKEGLRNHFKVQEIRRDAGLLGRMDEIDGIQLATAMARSARMCKKDGTWETRDEWAQRIIDNWFKQTAVHELGHALGLRHNFYGSMDLPHFGENAQISSIMEYDFTYAAGADSAEYHPWDVMSLSYIYGEKKPDPKENWLFCTDQHSSLSPFCTTHDIGTRPAEIIKNEIEFYEWMYKFRNFRTYRKFWNTSGYTSNIAYTLYPLRRFLNLWGADWYASEIKNDLMLLGVKGDQYFFDNITDEFNDEMGQANRLTANFYKAILQQSAGERSYATKFDTLFGDVTQQGIIMDKYYALFLFIGIWPVDDYDPNIYSYLSYHESSFGNSQYWSDVQDITDSMIGGQYDVYPWFKPLAVLLFAQDTTDIMFSDRAKHMWIQMRRFDRLEDLVNFFGFDPRTQCAPSFPDCKPALQADNPYQVFNDKDGAQWIYYYLLDRNQHLVASKDQNPTSFKILWDQNEDLNVTKLTYVDDYEIKYYLDYFEYFN